MVLEELEHSALRIERILKGNEERRPPPKPENSVCPSLAYRPPRESPRSFAPRSFKSATKFPRQSSLRKISFDIPEEREESDHEELDVERSLIEALAALTSQSSRRTRTPTSSRDSSHERKSSRDRASRERRRSKKRATSLERTRSLTPRAELPVAAKPAKTTASTAKPVKEAAPAKVDPD
uniref:Uncharacterized protein n=1 Tax=Bracon brevicornis TaxID=1563983 RepID=A0A6V7LXN6_9HYME